jgi:murein DD-endopeptidase MepM/ murein hydrolase activator NlpD
LNSQLFFMKKKFIYAGIILGSLIVLYFVFAGVSEYIAYHRSAPQEVPVDSSFLPAPPPKILYGLTVDSLVVEESTFGKNENLSEILSKYNISPQQIAAINQLPRESFDVRKLQTKKPYTIIHEKDTLKTARAFIYHPNLIEFVVLTFDDTLRVYNGVNPVDTIIETTTGVIESSLYNAITDAGGSPLLVSDLSEIFAWAIDFFWLQRGDAFKVIYERYEVHGADAGMGKIHCAWFQHQGKPFYAIPYDQGNGMEFFDDQGNSLRKTFLKAPLKFSRISSRFTYNRFHPVLKIHRAHTGVDYAAPVGTPVQAIGDGTVVMAGYSGGGGNTVKIRHNSVYTTGYMHLSRYGKGIKNGAQVKQGDVIGYVGSSGLSTGPHLDFRFWKNGQPVDPLKVDPPPAEPIKTEHRAAYDVIKEAMLNRLDSIEVKNLQPPV